MPSIARIGSTEEPSMPEIRPAFDDADAYERYMGRWSKAIGEKFLTWLAPPASDAISGHVTTLPLTVPPAVALTKVTPAGSDGGPAADGTRNRHTMMRCVTRIPASM
jgi:hypothetical protein